MNLEPINTDGMIPQGSFTRITYEPGQRLRRRSIEPMAFWAIDPTEFVNNVHYEIENCWIAKPIETVEINAAMITTMFPTADHNRELYQYIGLTNYRRHAAVVMEREAFEMPEAVALAMELPVQCFIAGGFAAAYINGVRPERFDVYFTGEAAFAETLKRLQNAPEGSFMHGYTQSKTAAAMMATNDGFLEFNHAEKPTVYLVRTRWYNHAQYLVDSIDLSCEQVALGSDMHLSFGASALQDAKDKILKLHRMNWKVNTAVDIPKYQARGYRVVGSERYNDRFAQDLANYLAGYTKYYGHNPQPFTHY